MKTITYIFWRFWKFRVNKDGGDQDSAYFFSTIFFAVFLVSIPLMILIGRFIVIPKLPEDNKIIGYLIVIPLNLLCSLPIRLVFPKKRILNLEYSIEERKHYKYNFYRFILIISILITVRYFHMKGYFNNML